jgi:hypothetical protein
VSSGVLTIALLDVANNAAVDAELRDAIEERQLADWEAEWRPFLYERIREMHRRGVERAQWPQNRHWDWRSKVASVRGLLGCRGICITCQGMTQGLMQLDLTRVARLEAQKGKPLVYVEYLEAAPWNRPELAAPPRFRGVGSALIAAAIAVSHAAGFKDRVGLHSLPQADGFYRGTCGMADLGPDLEYHGHLRYFEMTPDQADAFIR